MSTIRGKFGFHPANLRLSYEANDQVMDHGIELRARLRLRPDDSGQAGGTRPALTGDPMLPSQELLGRGPCDPIQKKGSKRTPPGCGW
jgi:hypothetical protein